MARQSTPGFQSQGADHTASLIVGIVIALTLLIIAIWLLFHTQIAQATLFVQGLELDLIGLFTHDYDALHARMRAADPARLSWSTLWTLAGITGSVLRYPVIAIVLGLAVLCLTRAPSGRYRERFGLDGMQKVMADLHPIGKAWIGASLPLTEPAPPGSPLRPLDPALEAGEWLARYAPDGLDTTAGLEQACSALGAQAGQRWTGPQSLQTADLVMFMALGLFCKREKKEAMGILENLSAALSGTLSKGAPQKPALVSTAYLRQLRRAYTRQGWSDALTIMDRHAHVRSGLLSLLQHARRRCGVVNPGLFSAIQLLDRDLWLVLSAVSYPRDRQPDHMLSITTCTEAAGAVEHWQAECVLGAPIPTPRVDRALVSLSFTGKDSDGV
ncbi:secretion/conjugation apparatus DotM-related subunit [Acetobacter vaccinii]|uniref:DotM C-terminal cytoplasmic domain-containing protein n=1 Tax=Acetobacter vaccinii TaxID=2592655 RepID=A0A5C1YQW7_9PROT|nr:hypothetical protein [Acetobacter vaccinii]QEO18746.1 hypothetical protein FLP30_12700 [Acetobacter vaccinii]